MLLMIDNYDSFTYNLVQYLGELGAQVKVIRNDGLSVAQIIALNPERVVLSPGPCSPLEAGVCVPLIRALAGRIPILGVCLGHQCIGAAFGATVGRATRVMHGKTDQLTHHNEGVFRGLPNPITVTRYHSLAIEPDTIGDDFVITATTSDACIMGIRHRQWALEGVQFHPESIATEHGHAMLKNFLQDKI